MVPLLPWELWPSEFEVQKNDSLALRTFIVDRSWRQIFFKLFELTILVVTILISRKKICLPWFPGGSSFKGLDDKIRFSPYLIVLTTDFLQFEIHIGLHTRFSLPNKKNNSPPYRPEQEMFHEETMNELFYCLCSKQSCEILAAFQ